MTAVRIRAAAERERAEQRWEAAVGASSGDSLDRWADNFRTAGRLTLNFHPDRVGRHGVTVAAGLLASGRYCSQWVTGLSAGSRSAVAGGERQRFERSLFDGAYDRVDVATDFPLYGSLDLVLDPHGGSPRFGSSFVELRHHVRERTTLCVGDSHMGPSDVGTVDEPESVLASLAEHAARHALLNRGLGIDVLLQVCSGGYRSERPSRDLDGYVEAQVHGGASLEADVETIVLDPSFRGTSVERDLQAAAQRYGFQLSWHGGSELDVDDVPDDFRGPTMPTIAQRVARPDGVLDARSIGVCAAQASFSEPSAMGDPPDSQLQQLKYLWHTVLAHGHDAAS
jgi:ribosomal protein S18 acetylase RimI-like enzyme